MLFSNLQLILELRTLLQKIEVHHFVSVKTEPLDLRGILNMSSVEKFDRSCGYSRPVNAYYHLKMIFKGEMSFFIVFIIFDKNRLLHIKQTGK